MKNFNVIALLAFLVVAVSMLVLNKGKSRQLQDKVMSVFSPFIHGSASVGDALSGGGDVIGDPVQLQKDNEKLQVEVQRLRIITKKYDELMDENNKLRRGLDYKQGSPFKVTAARVIKR